MVQSIKHLTCACTALLMASCSGGKEAAPRQKLPRPVSVITLQVVDPSSEIRLTGAAGSWKTEQLAFEVSGRVQYVIEPETDIEGDLFAYEQQVNEDGTPGERKRVEIGSSERRDLARIDSLRYKLKVASAAAQISTLEQKRKALLLEIEKVIPAERKSAEAELRFQQAELERVSPLVESGAITKSEFERTQANRDKADAAIVQSDAGKMAKLAEVASLDAQIEEATQTRLDAERDVDDTKLYSPFKGQIAKVHVTQGAFVNAGEPVLTVQMMDPIKIDLEVSAEQSRRLSYKEDVDVVIATSDAQEMKREATVYMIDPVADPNTRTFTVTLLMENTKVAAVVPTELQGQPIVRTNEVWRIFRERLGTTDRYLTEAGSIHQDEAGAYVWRIQNRDQQGVGGSRILDLAKVRVTPTDVHFRFLEIWTFRELAINEGEDFSLEHDRIAGPLTIPAELTEGFDGGKVLFDRPRWLVRPGDLVAVGLTGEQLTPGFYIPMNVISEQSGKYFVFVIDPGGGVAKQVEVKLFEAVNTRRRIEAVGDVALSEGTQIIAKGAHFIVDGEAVLVAEEVR